MSNKYFRAGVSNGQGFLDVNLNPITLSRGYKTTISVHPTSIISEEGIRSLSIEKRNCRFEDEVPDEMNLFKKYTPSACRFQCMLDFRYFSLS